MSNRPSCIGPQGLPAGPLLHWLDRHPLPYQRTGELAALARRINEARHRGVVSIHTADRVAVRTGAHVGEIYGATYYDMA